MRVAALVLALLGAGVAEAQPSPADLYGPLFAAVQEARVFPDGKTFVDAVPKRAADAIMADYAREQARDARGAAALRARQFRACPGVNDRGAGDRCARISARCGRSWCASRAAPVAGSSALPLPAPYVVPGGRFREIYYWDSYFTMLGLEADGQQRAGRGDARRLHRADRALRPYPQRHADLLSQPLAAAVLLR